MSDLRHAMGEVPAIVGTGFLGLRRGRYLLCRVECATLARAWLGEVVQARLIRSLGEARDADEEPGQAHAPTRRVPMSHLEAVTIGFSHAGLMELELEEDPAHPFPSAFRAGMGHPVRRRLLGEEPTGPDDGAFGPWRWSDAGSTGERPVHLLVAHYWHGLAGPHALLEPGTLKRHGLEAMVVLADERAIRLGPDGRLKLYEPFGFQDGVGQPSLRGLTQTRRKTPPRPDRPSRHAELGLVQPGEFVLGHRNEYLELSHSPNVIGWPGGPWCPDHFGTHGSYLVARQIQQHVKTFHDFVRQSNVERLASKMMGRRMNGWPLVTGPLPASGPDDFLYLASDEPGFECPRGAHVRRAHVRDALAHDEDEGIQSSRLHRLLRRGRVYVEDPAGAPTGDGIMFLALNADLDRQFEFVHRNWIMGSRFGDLSDEQDPILGVRPNRHFTVPACPVGQRVGPMPPFTTVLGGGYFLVPGMSALRFVAGL
jgi:porphyrinogen peroxidase